MDHTQEIMTPEAIAFGEWLSRCGVPAVLRGAGRGAEGAGRAAERGGRWSERRARARTLRLAMEMEVEDVVVATSDYGAAADDEVSLKAGDIVEVLDTKSAMGAKYRGRTYRYENHFFQPRGLSLNYIFSVPTYRMYYY